MAHVRGGRSAGRAADALRRRLAYRCCGARRRDDARRRVLDLAPRGRRGRLDGAARRAGCAGAVRSDRVPVTRRPRRGRGLRSRARCVARRCDTPDRDRRGRCGGRNRLPGAPARRRERARARSPRARRRPLGAARAQPPQRAPDGTRSRGRRHRARRGGGGRDSGREPERGANRLARLGSLRRERAHDKSALCLGRDVRGDRVPRAADGGAPRPSAEARGVLACLDARDLRGRPLDREPLPGGHRRPEADASRRPAGAEPGCEPGTVASPGRDRRRA